MNNGKPSRRDAARAILVAVGIVTVVLAAAVGAGAAAQNESSATNESQPEAATCDPGQNEPEMEQARLHASDKTVETDSPGRISGGFQVDPTANCPVVVHITMSVPSGMTISGSSDFTSSGAGMVTSRFTVEPGANIKDLSAEVYSGETGQRTVTADIQYWPEGHQDRAREIDGLSFTFDVEEETQPPEESEEEATAFPSAGGFTLPAVAAVLAVLSAVAIGRSSKR